MVRTIDDNKVVAIRCETYDRDRMKAIIADGMKRLNYAPAGKVFVKPNVVFAHKNEKFSDFACTATPLVGAALSAVADEKKVSRIDLGENSAIGFPTRLCYKAVGYYDEVKQVRRNASCPIGIYCMDEDRRESVFVGGNVHDNLRVSRTMARADTKIYLPKLKCHCVSAMTGAVKLNIGICSDDERSIRHDFLLNEKIVDLLVPGYPDFIVMDAIDVGMGNEAFPTVRKLGLILMGTNPLAVDLVGARLLGLGLEDVPYLKLAVERGYTPASLDNIVIEGDLNSLEDIEKQAERLKPYDDEFYRWQDVGKELKRLNSPINFHWGPYSEMKEDRCLTGCVMGVKMFLGSMEKFAGAEAFANADPVSLVIGKHDKPIDAKGSEVFIIGSCADVKVENARKTIHIDKCFTTAGDMNLAFAHRMGMPTIMRSPSFLLSYGGAIASSALKKTVGLRYMQDIGHFITKGLIRKI